MGTHLKCDGIWMLPVVAKIIAKIVLAPKKNHLNSLVDKGQAGFRSAFPPLPWGSNEK